MRLRIYALTRRNKFLGGPLLILISAQLCFGVISSLRARSVQVSSPATGSFMCGPIRLRAWSVPSVSKPTPAKTRPCGFVKPTPAGFCSRFGGQFRGNSPGYLGIYHTFVTPAQRVEALYVYCYYLFTIIHLSLLSSSIIYLPIPHARSSLWQPFKN